MIRVLLALDDTDTRAFYAANLGTAGFRVTTVRTREALQTARRTGPQVIVIGAAGDGSRCAALKRDAALAGVPVIALAEPHRAGGLEAVCDLVLPLDSLPDALIDAIDRVVLKTRS